MKRIPPLSFAVFVYADHKTSYPLHPSYVLRNNSQKPVSACGSMQPVAAMLGGTCTTHTH